MTTYTQSSHPLDIAAGINSALDTDDLRHMLADVLPRDVLNAITDWLDCEIREETVKQEKLEQENDALFKESEAYIDRIEKLEQQLLDVTSDRDTAVENFKACDALLAQMEVQHQHCVG